jgi:hypothetical protein
VPLALPQFEPDSTTICKYVRYRGAVISSSLKDSVFKLASGEIIKVHRVRLLEKETIVEARVITDLRALFTSTMDSRELGVYKTTLDVDPRVVVVKPSEIEHKFFTLPVRDNDFAIMPMTRIGGNNFDRM